MDGATGTIYVNEINTIPGFTTISMYSKMWAAAMRFADDRISRNAAERYRNLASCLALPPKPPQHLNPLFGPFHVRLRNPQIAPRC